jgi:hypothetical protein
LFSDSETLSFALPGVTVAASGGYQTELVVALDQVTIGAVVDAALRQAGLRDLAIEDQPLDEVIRALYADADAERRRVA